MSGQESKKRRAIYYAAVLAGCVILAVLEFFPPEWSKDELINDLLGTSVKELLGAAVFMPIALRSGYRVFGFRPGAGVRDVLVFLAALLVALNNIPFIGLATGAASVTRGGKYIALYVLRSLSIGLFEELAFRGVLYPAILEKRRSSTRSIFLATAVSSALFGLVHLFNLFLGAAPGGVLLQIGYSFLIGGMCSIVLLKTGCVWLCVLIHGLFDFGGFLIEKLGEGKIWDPVTVTLTAVIGCAVLVYMLFVIFGIRPEETDFLYAPEARREEENQ